MGSGFKKNKKFSMGKGPTDDESWDAYLWGIRNGILISPIAISESRWRIDIVSRGKKHTSPDSYGKDEIWEKIFEYYKYYYNKYDKH